MSHNTTGKTLAGVVGTLVVLTSLAFSKPPVSQNPGVTAPIAQGKFQIPFMTEPTPTPVPFAELTIPHLRQRLYNSTLGQLTRVADNGTYTSYTTSYTSDGLKVNGLLTQPNSEAPAGGWPAVVFIHGYIPPQNYQTLTRYTDHVNFLARNGFVVFKIDLRGHGTSEGEPGGGYYSSDYVIDGLNAQAALASSGFVHPDKIGFWGHSMAGNVVMRILAAAPDTPAVVMWAGAGYTYEDLREFGIDDNSYQPPPNDSERQRKRRELFEKHGQFDPNSEFWKQVVPTNYLSDIKGAVQLSHAIDDNVVSIEYSRNLNQILNSTSIPHELNELPSGGHNITGSSFTTAMQKAVEFYRIHLNKN